MGDYSPYWYISPAVPTWNYQAAHIYGSCKLFSDKARLVEVIKLLTQKYESGFDSPCQPTYNDSLFEGIIGLEITITDLQCKYKLSQNRSVEDQEQLISQLENINSNELAEVMDRQTQKRSI